MIVKGQPRPPAQRRPGELIAEGRAPEPTDGPRPGLDAPPERFQEGLRTLAKARDALQIDARDPTEVVLGLDPVALVSGERTSAVLAQQPEVAAQSGVDPQRLKARLAQFQAGRRLVSSRGLLQQAIHHSQRTHGTVARRSCQRAVQVLRGLVAADGPQGLARFGVDLTEDQYLELCNWAQPILEQADEISQERAAQQQQTQRSNQASAEKVKKAQSKTRLMQLILKLNNDQELDAATAEEVVRLYDEAHGKEQERRGAGR